MKLSITFYSLFFIVLATSLDLKAAYSTQNNVSSSSSALSAPLNYNSAPAVLNATPQRTTLRRACCPFLMGSCAFTIVGTTLLLYLTYSFNNPDCGIAPGASVQGMCWQSPVQNCCGLPEQTIYGDPLANITQGFDLKQAVSEKVFYAGCDALPLCLEQIDCAKVDKTSPNYYKNFNPCAGLVPIPTSNRVKPSRLTRKIAMARDKQKRSKAHKK